jgi:UDP-2,4-diacetamido-2,4,6-trideoxy-beta-L-altropyranose hydrolase
MNIRKATMADADRLLQWRNDPVTRSMSIDTIAVQYADHINWLGRSLSNLQRLLFIVDLQGVAAGTCRFDIEGDMAEISITISQQMRGNRLAVPIILSALDALRRERPNVLIVTATIKSENAASMRSFEKAGFALEGSDGTLNHYRRLVSALPR